MEKRAHKAVKMLGKIILLLLLCLGLPILVSSPYDDTHELLSSDGDSHHIKSIPKDVGSVEFSYYEIWIDKTTYLLTKTILYDKSSDKYKQYEMLEMKAIQGFPTITKFSMTNLQNGESTVATMSNVK